MHEKNTGEILDGSLGNTKQDRAREERKGE
jgi:hypothetical protein